MPTIPLLAFNDRYEDRNHLRQYLDHLHYQKSQYSAELIDALRHVVEHTSRRSISSPKSWHPSLSSDQKPDYAIVSRLCAMDLTENTNATTISHNCGSSCDTDESERLLKSEPGKIAAEIIYVHSQDPKGVKPFPRWDAKCVTETVEKKSNASDLIGSIPIPSPHGENATWRTNDSFTSDTPSYASIFSQSGAIEKVKLGLAGGQVFSWHVFGVSLRLIWPITARNVEAARKCPPKNYYSPDLSWCLTILPDYEIFFVRPSETSEYHATIADCGSWSSILTFTPSHRIDLELYSEALHGKVEMALQSHSELLYLPEVGDSLQLETGNTPLSRGKALWTAYLRSMGQEADIDTEKGQHMDQQEHPLVLKERRLTSLPSPLPAVDGTGGAVMQQNEIMRLYDDNLHIKPGSSTSLAVTLTLSRSSTLYLAPAPGQILRSNESQKAAIEQAQFVLVRLMSNMGIEVQSTEMTRFNGLNDLTVDPNVLHMLRPLDFRHWKSALDDVWSNHLFHLHSFQGFDSTGQQSAVMIAQDTEVFTRLGADTASIIKNHEQQYIDAEPQNLAAGQPKELVLYFPRIAIFEEFPIKYMKPSNRAEPYWEPFTELTQSAELMLKYYISDPLAASLTVQLQQCRSEHQWGDLITAVHQTNILIKNTYTLPMHAPQGLAGGTIPRELVCSIIDNSYLRLISNSPKNYPILRKNTYAWDSTTYGELTPDFIDHILDNDVSLKEGDVFCDVGSGLSAIGLQIALRCGAKAFCIEKRTELHELALRYREVFDAYCNRWMLPTPSCKSSCGDATKDHDFQMRLFTSKLIIINNAAFGDTCGHPFTKSICEESESLIPASVCRSLATLIEEGCRSHTFIVTTKVLPLKVAPVTKPVQKGFLGWRDNGNYFTYELNRPGS